MTRELIAPAAASAHRQVYEMGLRKEDPGIESLARVGALMEHIGQSIYYEGCNPSDPDSASQMVDLYEGEHQERLRECLDSQIEFAASLGSPTVLRHLQVMGDFADHMVLLPELAAIGSEQASEKIRNLIEGSGLYHLAGMALKRSLEDYDKQLAAGEDEEKTWSMGSITEFTALALANRANSRDESPNLSTAAIPATPAMDFIEKKDLQILYRRHHDLWRWRYPQVKSNEFRHPPLTHQPMIGGIRLGNGANADKWQPWGDPAPFQTSRAIVRDIEGRPRDEAETAMLKRISRNLTKMTRLGRSYVEDTKNSPLPGGANYYATRQ